MSWKQPFVVHPDGLIPYSTIFHDWVLELSKRKRLGGTMLAAFMLLCEHVEFGNEAGSTTGTRCYCNHDGKHFVTGDNNHCDYWEEAQ